MHTPYCQVVVVIVRQSHSTYQHCYHSAHIEKLSNHIAHYPKYVSKCYLGDFALD